MPDIVYVILFSLLGGVFALCGGWLLLVNKKRADRLALISLPFAAGTLLGAAFLDLLPEALEEVDAERVFVSALLGMLIFFLLERFLHWFHHHHEHAEPSNRPTSALIITGDTIHNAIDGVAIGAAFLVSIPTGIITTLAVAAHEIPQEVGDFGLLVKLGYKRNKVLLINVLSALATLPVALITFLAGGLESFPLGELLGGTAGLFIYIASSDLIPRIHASAKNSLAKLETFLLIFGVVLISLLVELTHSYLG